MQKFSSALVPGADGFKHTGRDLEAGLVTDGPRVEAMETIVSFGVIQADDYNAALATARECLPGSRSRSANWLAKHERAALQKHLIKGT
jgi:hypothetical protein